MSLAAKQYLFYAYLYRQVFYRFVFYYNLTFLLAAKKEADETPQEPNDLAQKSPLERTDCAKKWRIGSTVTGKELDDETGYMYFGARYYDPKVSVWLSTDPALGEYLPTAKQVYFPKNEFKTNMLIGNGGVYYPINLNTYHYASINPLKYYDPDGQAIFAFFKFTYTDDTVTNKLTVRYAVVKPGESVWEIARQYNKLMGKDTSAQGVYKTYQEILKKNPQIKNPNKIKPGDVILLGHERKDSAGTTSAPDPFITGKSIPDAILGFLEGLAISMGIELINKSLDKSKGIDKGTIIDYSKEKDKILTIKPWFKETKLDK